MVNPKGFTPNYYLKRYPDVAASADYGSYSHAESHFKKYGKKEGRSPNFFYDPSLYQAYYDDVKNAYGENQWEKFLKHWLKYGYKEGRRGGLFFDPSFYLSHHPDLVAAFGPANYEKAYQHWVQHGIDEGRRTVPEITGPIFDPGREYRVSSETFTVWSGGAKQAVVTAAIGAAKWIRDNPEKVKAWIDIAIDLWSKHVAPDPNDEFYKEFKDWANDPDKEHIILEPGDDPFPNIA